MNRKVIGDFIAQLREENHLTQEHLADNINVSSNIIKKLEKGKYTLTETIAPEGYRLSTETVKFSVKGDGTTTKVVMYNEIKKQTIVKINKIDSETKQPLKGATLIIKDSKGNDVNVSEWKEHHSSGIDHNGTKASNESEYGGDI